VVGVLEKSDRVPRLVAEHISVHFGHVRAVDDVTVEVERGEIIGLIGPNGSGKTTLVNVLSGFLAPAVGRVCFDGNDITLRSPESRARIGLARTFQAVRLFGSLTVEENVEIGALASGLSRRETQRRVGAVLARMKLTDVARVPAQDLPYGLERLVSIARAAVGRPSFFLLDEPAAGLNEFESDELLEALRETRDDLECGMLVIEHDMRVITRLCARLYVLDSGSLIASGEPSDVMRDKRVIEAYLGNYELVSDARR
jgi:branched-chain amino acid transport system ATP-binding protein